MSILRLPSLFVEAIGNQVSFYDRDKGDVVRAYVDYDMPRMTRFEVNEEIMEPRHILTIGDGICQRDVLHYTTAKECSRLRVGITIHRGPFSSLPHEFEKYPEPGFEEAFYVITPGKGLLEGEGLLGDNPVDIGWPIRNGDLIQVPMGWHRVVSLPNENSVPNPMAYVWGYLCKRPEWEKA